MCLSGTHSDNTGKRATNESSCQSLLCNERSLLWSATPSKGPASSVPTYPDVTQIKEDPPAEEWEPTKHTFKIKTTQDLWRVCHKSKTGRICVPELEFEIQADGQRHIDTIYNHIGGAITNLAAHVSTIGGGAHPATAPPHVLRTWCASKAGCSLKASCRMTMSLLDIPVRSKWLAPRDVHVLLPWIRELCC
jgi:ZPR1 zinc-finger domain